MLKMNLRFMMCALILGLVTGQSQKSFGQFVPGSGVKFSRYGDDFENPKWKFVHNHPKSSKEQDENIRYPRGYAINKRWFESAKRGQPDKLERVPTPAGGLEGSEFSLMMQSLRTGIPGKISYEQMQDDFLMNGQAMPVSWEPSCVVRVYVPEFDEWEQRPGVSFGIRADCSTTVVEADEKRKRGKRLRFLDRIRKVRKKEPYWPGFFVVFNSKNNPKNEKDFAHIIIRSNSNGNEVQGPKIMEPGWWTFGMSFTSDGRVHYYASQGVDDLKAEDHITSQFPYGYQAETFSTMFFNVVNKDDGKSWSTKWIIDDPALYYRGGSAGVARGNSKTRTK